MSRAVLAIQVNTMRMSRMNASCRQADSANFRGRDVWRRQRLADSDQPVDQHRYDHSDENRRQRTVHIIIEHDLLHLDDALGRCEDLSARQSIAEVTAMGNETDAWRRVEYLLEPGCQRTCE